MDVTLLFILTLKDDCKIIPCKAKIYAALGHCPSVLKRSWVSRTEFGNLILQVKNDHNYKFISNEVVNEPYDCQRNNGSNLLSEIEQIFEIDFSSKEDISKYLRKLKIENLDSAEDSKSNDGQFIRKEMKLTNNQKNVNCIISWFELIFDKSETVKLNTMPNSNLCWEQAVFPLKPLNLQKIEVNFEISDGHLRATVGEEPFAKSKSKDDILMPAQIIHKINTMKPLENNILTQFSSGTYVH